MLAPKAQSLAVEIGRHELTVVQSPGLLQSNRDGGTTGAIVWRTSLFLARWLMQSNNLLSNTGVLKSGGSVIELGAGCSGIVSAVLATKLGSEGTIIASDMHPVTKLLQKNIDSHIQVLNASQSKAPRTPGLARINVTNFDWEQDEACSFLSSQGLEYGVDATIACDCVFNYALIQPFLDTCRDICRARQSCIQLQGNTDTMSDLSMLCPTVCIVVQQIRQPDVLEEWLKAALNLFTVWRIPSHISGDDLAPVAGRVMHILALKV